MDKREPALRLPLDVSSEEQERCADAMFVWNALRDLDSGNGPEGHRVGNGICVFSLTIIHKGSNAEKYQEVSADGVYRIGFWRSNR